MRQIHPSAWMLAGLSALLQVLIFPLPSLYVLSWVALAPLIIALLRTRPSGVLEIENSTNLEAGNSLQGFVLAYACGVLWYAGTCYWIFDTMRQYGGLSTAAAVFVLLLFCLYLGLYHGLFGLCIGLLARSGSGQRRALLAAPFLWVAVELARTRITGFPWNLLGTAQVDNVPLCRIAAWTGVYGISWEIMLVNVAFAAAFLLPKKKRSPLIVAALAAAVVLQAGRLMEAPPAMPDHQALLVQQNIPVAADWTQPYFQQTLTDLAGLTANEVTKQSANAEKNSSNKLDLVVWPESPAPFYTNDPIFRDALSELARRTKTWILAGAIGITPSMHSASQASQVFNSAVLVSPGGEWTARYDKVHLVPFGEYLPMPGLFSFAGGLTQEVGQFQKGTSRVPLRADGKEYGVFICYESIFPDEVRQSAREGAQVFVNISNDGWYGDSGAYAQHLNQTRMRAIENDRWLLSATDTGVTASINPWGSVVARLPRKQRLGLVVPYALSSVTTFYTRYGDWFAYACAIISFGALLPRFLPREKANVSA